MKIMPRWLPSLALCLAGLPGATPASAANGLLALKTPCPARQTMNRFAGIEPALRARCPDCFGHPLRLFDIFLVRK